MPKAYMIPSTYVPTLIKANAVASLCKNSSAPDLFHYNGFIYIITGFVGAGDAKNYKCFYAMLAVPLAHYRGSLTPMLYDNAFNAVNEGKRERGYYAMMVNVKGANYVMVEYVEFHIHKNETWILELSWE